MNENQETKPILLRRAEVENLTSMSCTSIYARMRDGSFPEPLKIGRSVRWRRDEIVAWIDTLDRSHGDLART